MDVKLRLAVERVVLCFSLLQISVKNSFVEGFLRRFLAKAPEVEGEQPSARLAGRETPNSFEEPRKKPPYGGFLCTY